VAVHDGGGDVDDEVLFRVLHLDLNMAGVGGLLDGCGNARNVYIPVGQEGALDDPCWHGEGPIGPSYRLEICSYSR